MEKLDGSKAEESGGKGRRISERQQMAAARKQSQEVQSMIEEEGSIFNDYVLAGRSRRQRG